MPRFQVPLVGSYYYKPATALLQSVPSGTPLDLRPEPFNQYDENAVAVWLSPSHIPVVQRGLLEPILAGFGFSLEELLEEGPRQVGHLAKEFAAQLQSPIILGKLSSAILTFTGSGKPQVIVELTDGGL